MRYEYENDNKLDSIELTLAMGCPLNCHYCPQKLLLNRYFENDQHRSHMMSFDTFKTILTRVKKGGSVCFSGMCEPFLNPECDDMILYAYQQGYRILLLTTLQGFHKGSIDKLKNIDFDSITLHIPDKEGNSKFIITEEYLELLKLFHENFHVSSYSCHGTIHPVVEPYINKKIFLSNTMFDRAGNLEYDMQKYEPKGEIICMVGTNESSGSWTPEVLPDGTLTLCCMDYGMKHILGNIVTSELEEILDGKEYHTFQKGLKQDTIDILCRKCIMAREIKDTPAYCFQRKKQNYEAAKKDQLNENQIKIIQYFEKADTICVFGLGKLFWNIFFNHKWNEVLGHNFYCDNDPKLWGKEIDGIKCISPDELQKVSNPLVITCIKNDKSLRDQLLKMGIGNIINIKELYC